MDSIEIIFIAFLVIGVYGYLLFSSISTYSEKMRLVRILKKIPTSKIKDVKGDYVEIKGNLCDSQEKFTSPVSKASCLYYEVLLEKKVTKCTGVGKSRNCSSYWVTVMQDSRSNIIKVQDDTGTIMVNMPEATTNLVSDFKDKVSTFDPAKEEMKDFMKNDLGIDNVEGIFRGDYRLKEAYLEPGDTIYAIGDAYEIDGQLCIGKDTVNNYPFMVSDKSEEQISQEYRNTAILHLMAIIGLLALPIAAAIFFYHA